MTCTASELRQGAGTFNCNGPTDGAWPNVWCGLPTKAGQRLMGLPRSAFYTGINEGKIKSACIKKPGALTGKRLVWLPSVLSYIESFTVTVEPELK